MQISAKVQVLVGVFALTLSSCGTNVTKGLASVPVKTTTTLVASTSKVRLQGCPTETAVPPERATPSDFTNSQYMDYSGLPSDFNRQLTIYVMADGLSGGLNTGLAAPSGWSCKAGVGADGNRGITVTGPTSQSVELFIPNGGAQSAYMGSPFFPAAQAFSAIPSSPSPAVIGETIQQMSPSEVLYQDPAGVKGNGQLSGGKYADKGVVIWVPERNGQSWAVQADCALPSSESGLCRAILNFVSYWYTNPSSTGF